MRDTRTLLKTAMFTPGLNGAWGLPIGLKSDPGMAKSSMLTTTAREFGLHALTLIGSIRPAEDFSGLPTKGEHGVAVLPFPWVQELLDNPWSVLNVDELTCMPAAVQAAALRLFLDRVVGDVVLPRTVRIVTAFNDVADAANGTELAVSMANRIVHLPWDGGSAEDWINWAISDGGDGTVTETLDPKVEEARVMAEWPHRYAMTRGVVTGFISRFRDLLHKKPAEGDPALQAAWPSRRTWEMAMRAEAGAAIHGLNEVDREVLIEGCVGRAAAAQYLTYLAETSLPDPRDLLDGKVSYKHTNRLDMTLAVYNSCAMLVAPPTAEKRADRAKALWGMLASTVDTHADVVVPAATLMSQSKLGTSAEAIKVLAKVAPVFAATGQLKGRS